MKKVIYGVISVIIIIVLVYIRNGQTDTAVTSNNNINSILPVDVYPIDYKTLDNEIFVTGTLRALEETELHAEASGRVTIINFTEGQNVKKGQVLIQLNDNELQARWSRINVELDFANKTLNRQQKLFDKGGISREQFERTLSQVNVLKAQRDETVAQINERKIVAPYDGTIGLRYISPGDYISPSTKTAWLHKISDLILEFSVPEKYFQEISVDDRVTFTITNIDSVFDTRIYAVEPKIDPDTRTVIIRALFKNQDYYLKPGLFAYVQYRLNSIDNAILIPTQALVPELKGQKVYLYKMGKVYEKSVLTGKRTDNYIQITDGLVPGDTVITTGILQIRQGMSVRIRDIN